MSTDTRKGQDTEETLQESEQRFRALIENSSDAIALINAQGLVTYASPSNKHINGYTPEELTGVHWSTIIHADDHKPIEQKLHSISDQDSASVSAQYRVLHKNGSIRWMEGTAINLLATPGISAFVVNYRDITERKEAEELLRQSEERYRILIEQASDAIFLVDREGYYIDVNTSGCKLTGYSREELLHKKMGDMSLPEGQQMLLALHTQLQPGETRLTESIVRRKDGSLVPIEINAKKLPNGFIQGIVRDISERKRIEEEHNQLLQREQAARQEAERERARLELAQRAGKVGMFEWDMQNNTMVWSPELEAIYGNPDPSIPRTYESWFQVIHREDREKIQRIIEEAIQERKEINGQFRIYRRDRSIRWVESKAHVYYNEAGEPVRMLGVNMDVTERVHAEQRKDEFLGIASHELRTPLTVVMGNIEMAHINTQQLLETSEDSTLNKKLHTVLTLLRRAEQQIDILAQLVDDLLDVSRIQSNRLEMRMERCNLRSIVEDIITEQRQLAPERTITFECSCSSSIPVLADANRIGQVVTNYLTNALKYSLSDRPVTVRLEQRDSQAYVAVQDQGVGIPQSYQKQLWERFYRVPDIEVQAGSGVGLGLGLHICKTIIEQHHGHVGVESIPGKGSTFWFTLPISA